MARRDYSQDLLRQRVEHWSKRLKVGPRIVRVRRMTRKWGSCSTKGIVTLAEDLAHQRPGFQDFVIAHELLHLRIPNHGKVFKALMNLHVPGWQNHDVARRVFRNGAQRYAITKTRLRHSNAFPTKLS